jgi:hypothetical protein
VRAQARVARPALSRTTTTPSTPEPDAASVADLTRVGQLASAAGDFPTAVVAFRKRTYLASDDSMTDLDVGLALEGAGSSPVVHR